MGITESADIINKPIFKAAYIQVIALIVMISISIILLYFIVSKYLSPLAAIQTGLTSFFDFINYKTKNVCPMMYETFKRVVDEDFSEIFAKQKAKSLVFWGESDESTPLYCGEKMHQFLKNSTFYPLEGNHFFFLKHSAFIAQKIKEI